ncbi:MAG TPA: hypothetical protein VN903_25580 [Polyangia bacterium]|nr:hypothetical protein [Polyangia bacterium]
MSWFHKALTILGYVGTVGGPLAAVLFPAIGLPMWAVGAITTGGGIALHLAQSPLTPQAAVDAATQAAALTKAVEEAKKAP